MGQSVSLKSPLDSPVEEMSSAPVRGRLSRTNCGRPDEVAGDSYFGWPAATKNRRI
jgi:hypothetical protein